MIEAEDAVMVVETIAKNLIGVSRNRSNFERLPDTFWGYYARGHDAKGMFGVIVTYSENGSDVDDLIRMYEQWVVKSKSRRPVL
ncbi:MAG TPA: hypothetical protein VNI77_09615 [Nitrososphaera sp.]|nr:hypothetical protein [Nitrososphaera sp.]